MTGEVLDPPKTTFRPPPTWDLLDTVDTLTEVVRAAERAGVAIPDGVEKQLVQLRHASFDGLDRTPGQATSADTADATAALVGPSGLPEFEPHEITADGLRQAFSSHGCAIIRGAIPPATVEQLVSGIDLAFDEVERQEPPYQDLTGSVWFDPLVLDKEDRHLLHRNWVVGSGVLTCDSPRLLRQLLDAYEATGLRKLVGDYLGERPVLSAPKCTLRRITAEHTEANWHQDGAFLGPGIRAINLWTALADCGADAPGLDIVPRRFDHMVETGTTGAWFDWAVSDDVVATYAASTPVVRPVFRPGDVIAFDDMLLHRTATDPAMAAPRYSVETWAFAPSAYPDQQVLFVW